MIGCFSDLIPLIYIQIHNYKVVIMTISSRVQQAQGIARRVHDLNSSCLVVVDPKILKLCLLILSIMQYMELELKLLC